MRTLNGFGLSYSITMSGFRKNKIRMLEKGTFAQFVLLIAVSYLGFCGRVHPSDGSRPSYVISFHSLRYSLASLLLYVKDL